MSKLRPELSQIMLANNDAIFTIEEAARLLGMTRQGLRHRITKGQIKAVKIVGLYYINGRALKSQVSQ